MTEKKFQNLSVVVKDVDYFFLARNLDYRSVVHQMAEQQLAEKLSELPKLPLGYHWVRDKYATECREIVGCDPFHKVFELMFKFGSEFDVLHRRKRRKASKRRWARYIA